MFISSRQTLLLDHRQLVQGKHQPQKGENALKCCTASPEEVKYVFPTAQIFDSCGFLRYLRNKNIKQSSSKNLSSCNKNKIGSLQMKVFRNWFVETRWGFKYLFFLYKDSILFKFKFYLFFTIPFDSWPNSVHRISFPVVVSKLSFPWLNITTPDYFMF